MHPFVAACAATFAAGQVLVAGLVHAQANTIAIASNAGWVAVWSFEQFWGRLIEVPSRT